MVNEEKTSSHIGCKHCPFFCTIQKTIPHVYLHYTPLLSTRAFSLESVLALKSPHIILKSHKTQV
jgi:hypothetical protein